MSKPVAIASSCLLLAASACAGTETGNPPVIGFGNSGCHDQAYDKGIMQSLEPMTPNPLYKGLTCFHWQHPDADTIRIELSNYETACGSDMGWKPQLEQREDGGIDIILQDDDCQAFRCGWCMHDLSFTFELERPLDGEVRVYQRGCGDQNEHLKRATLPLATQPAGTVCSYTHSVALDMRNGAPGSERMPCGPTNQSQTCEPDLSCVDVGTPTSGALTGGPRCLATCTDDATCDELTSCQNGVCRLREIGVFSN
jgi:hypothetical protein